MKRKLDTNECPLPATSSSMGSKSVGLTRQGRILGAIALSAGAEVGLRCFSGSSTRSIHVHYCHG
jgi:hypothetical protein